MTSSISLLNTNKNYNYKKIGPKEKEITNLCKSLATEISRRKLLAHFTIFISNHMNF